MFQHLFLINREKQLFCYQFIKNINIRQEYITFAYIYLHVLIYLQMPFKALSISIPAGQDAGHPYPSGPPLIPLRSSSHVYLLPASYSQHD